MICEKCQKVLQIGEYPFCGGRNNHGFPVHGLKQIGDEIDEWNENVGHEPVHFTSRAERKRYLKEHGLVEFVRHVDGDQHVARWV